MIAINTAIEPLGISQRAFSVILMHSVDQKVDEVCSGPHQVYHNDKCNIIKPWHEKRDLHPANLKTPPDFING